MYHAVLISVQNWKFRFGRKSLPDVPLNKFRNMLASELCLKLEYSLIDTTKVLITIFTKQCTLKTFHLYRRKPLQENGMQYDFLHLMTKI